MANRIYNFLEEKEIVLEAWEGAPAGIMRCIENHRITVKPGYNRNHADLEIVCSGIGLTFKFSLSDLWQEHSPMLESMEVEDSEDFDFFEDTIPPFGVVELYNIELGREQGTTEEEVKSFFNLLNYFLIMNFMMYVFRESESQSIKQYILYGSSRSSIKTFDHDGEIGYRVKQFG